MWLAVDDVERGPLGLVGIGRVDAVAHAAGDRVTLQTQAPAVEVDADSAGVLLELLLVQLGLVGEELVIHWPESLLLAGAFGRQGCLASKAVHRPVEPIVAAFVEGKVAVHQAQLVWPARHAMWLTDGVKPIWGTREVAVS